MKYIREFIDLKQDATGFNFSGSKVSGHCKYEVIHGKAKLKLTLNNLRPGAGPYTVNVVKCDGDHNVAVQLGTLDVSSDGRSQFVYSKQLTDSKDSRVLKDFDVLMVRLEDHSRDIITPAIGYRRETLLWRQNFHYFNEEIDLKKFGVHIDDVVQEEKMDHGCGCASNDKDMTENTVMEEPEEVMIAEPDGVKEDVVMEESEDNTVTDTMDVNETVMDAEVIEDEVIEDDTTSEDEVIADGIPTEEEPEPFPPTEIEMETEGEEDLNEDEPLPVTPEPETEPNIIIDTEDNEIIEVGSENERSKPVESFEEGLRQLQESIEKEFRSIQSSYGFEQEQSNDVTVDYVDYDDHCIHKDPKTMSKEQLQQNKDFIQGMITKEEDYTKEDVKVDEPEEESTEEMADVVTEEDVTEESVQNAETTEDMKEEDEAAEILDPVEEILRSEGVKRFSRKADDMFNTYPHLSPFEKQGEQEHWIRIEPRDIAIFPINTWRFMNNPFLINGYYKHHHILLGERLTKEKHQVYTIAVPAQYNSKQKRIANAHGFDFFRSCRNAEPKTGEFGYWMKEIHIHPSKK